MPALFLEPARSGLWAFPPEAAFERIAAHRFHLTPHREAAHAASDHRGAMQPLTELFHGRDQVLHAYRRLVRRLFRQWVAGIDWGVEPGAGAGFFYRNIILEDPGLSRRFSRHWIQFEINKRLVDHTRRQLPGADIRTGNTYDLILTPAERARQKFLLAVSSFDVLRFPGRAASSIFSLLNTGEYFLLIQDMLPGGESILLAERVRRCFEGDETPPEFVAKMRPDGTRDMVKITYRGFQIPTVDYYHTRICAVLAGAGFEIAAEGYATQTWTGERRPEHCPEGPSPAPNHFTYCMGCRDYRWDPALPPGTVREALQLQVIVARKP